MIRLDIPGRGAITLQHLVSDVNGTLAVDGHVSDDVAQAFTRLQDRLELHLVTGNIHGNQARIDRQLGVKAVCVRAGQKIDSKAEYVCSLGREGVVALGQGANDAGMLAQAALGICVLSPEGLAVETMLAADVLAPDVISALALLENPLRLVATLHR